MMISRPKTVSEWIMLVLAILGALVVVFPMLLLLINAFFTYRSALGVFEYEVVSVIRGTYPGKTIRIAHLIVMNNEFTTINQRAPGFRMSLEVEPLSKYPNLEKIQTIDDLDPAYDLDLFVPKL